jgi:3-deoxy-D-manno-octulosonic-acid transferase
MTQWHPGHKILMIDKVGYLSSLYGQSNIAYIGGGQHHRIHNIQEPAAHGIPICFGPKYHDFKEAEDIIHAGGAKVITDAKSLIDYITDMKLNTEKSASIGNMNQNYILSKAGATGRILSILDTAKYI